MRNIFSIIFRFLGLWVFNGICLLICNWLLPGLSISADPLRPFMVTVMSAALAFTLMNLLIRPVILLLAIPLNGLTFGLFSLVINAGLLYLVLQFNLSFRIDSLGTAFFAGFLFAAFNVIVTSLIPIDEDFLYYDILGERLRKRVPEKDLTKKGIVVIEIDGLSHDRLIKAIERRKMPYLKELMDSGKFTVSAFDCGVPSQTSSCQAGIMFGDNTNICAFRWYDKEKKRVISSSSFSDTGLIEESILGTQKTGLLDGGMSINNLLSGNAAVSMFTVSSMRPKSSEELQMRNIDLYLFSLKPYLLTKSILFTFFDMLIEVLQYLWAWLRNKRPRLNRLRRFYPIIRGITNVLLRDVSTALMINEIHRGGPASYATFYGYDEIAHHSGPDSFEAFHALSGIDHAIKKIHHASETKPGREYELFVISDHGQSFGSTFKQRYGISLSDHIRYLALECANAGIQAHVIGIGNNQDNDSSIRAGLSSLQPAGQSKTIGIPQTALNKIDTILAKNDAEALEETHEFDENDIWVLASGNLANVYFSFSDEKVTLAEIESVYPNFCARLIEHPGVGLLVVQNEGEPIAIGKSGTRYLTTGALTGVDPLLVYTKADVRAEQLSYLSQFPNGGDILVFSSVYPDGTVAAFEELIGSHGGIGGEQNSPFIFHASEIAIPEDIINSTQVYEVLKSRRLLDCETAGASAEKEAIPAANEWGWQRLIAGIRDTRRWTPLLRDILLFQPAAYRKISQDSAMNGPGLLMLLVSLIANQGSAFHFVQSPHALGLGVLTWAGSWLILMLAAYSSLLSLRVEVKWSPFLRAMLFSGVFDVLWIAALIPGYHRLWGIVILANHVISVSVAILGMADVRGRTRLLILPVMLLLITILILTSFVLIESIAYILDIQPLIQLIRGINLVNGIP